MGNELMFIVWHFSWRIKLSTCRKQKFYWNVQFSRSRLSLKVERVQIKAEWIRVLCGSYNKKVEKKMSEEGKQLLEFLLKTSSLKTEISAVKWTVKNHNYLNLLLVYNDVTFQKHSSQSSRGEASKNGGVEFPFLQRILSAAKLEWEACASLTHTQ